MRVVEYGCIGHHPLGLMLGKSISCCLSTLSSLLASNMNAVFSRIWALEAFLKVQAIWFTSIFNDTLLRLYIFFNKLRFRHSLLYLHCKTCISPCLPI